jgi:hypothetical protein
MKNLILKTHQPTTHFKEYSRQKVRELGIERAVNYFRSEKNKFKNNMYSDSWLYICIYNQCIDYITNDLAK